MTWRYLQTALLVAATFSRLVAEQVVFRSAEAEVHEGAARSLEMTIDGIDASPRGWSVGDRLESPRSVVFVTTEPVRGDLLELSLCFLSGRPHASFADFALFFTTDAMPSTDGHWEPMPLLNFSATTIKLSRGPTGRVLAEEVPRLLTGTILDEIYRITTRLPGKAVTGFRIEVFPVLSSERPQDGPVMSWSINGQFMLTEFRVEIISTSTNVALGCPVVASHPLYSFHGLMKAGSLTDGWPSTIAHPAEDVTGEPFHFEIDLGTIREMDHLGIRQRGDPYDLNRFARMWIKLYEQDPKGNAPPSWQVLNRADGTYPTEGEIDLLRASDGQGNFRGRYVRISTENPVHLSPMLAELEVYETRTPRLVAVTADDPILPDITRIRVPPGTLRLGLRFEIPGAGKPNDRLFRWRLRGGKHQWRTANSLLLEVPCPPPGYRVFDVQAAHSDGLWDATSISIPMVILEPFTRSRTFYWLMVLGILSLGGMIAWAVSQRHIARLSALSQLAAERTRIARDMHDDVGARLSQLSFMLKALAAEPGLPPPAREEISLLTEAAGAALGSLDEVVWTVNPKNDQLDALCRHLCRHATRYLAPLGIACRIESEKVWPDREISAQARHQITMAFREALQNVVKHSGATEVAVRLSMADGQLRIVVSDNGRGLANGAEPQGRCGMENMKARLVGIGGTCYLRFPAAGGAEVELHVPIG